MRIAAEVKDFDATGLVPRRRRGASSGTCSSRSRRRRRRSRTAASRRSTEAGRNRPRVGDRRRPRISWSRRTSSASAGPIACRRISCPTSRRLSERPGRDLARHPRAELRGRSACATGSHAVGEAAELIKRGDADAALAGGTESCMHPLILAGFCAMRGLAAEEEHPPRASRPFDATRAGFVMGEGGVRPAARGLRRGTRARRERLRGGARLRRLQRRAPHGAARPGLRGRRGDDARRAPSARRWRPKRVGYINAHGTSTPLGDAAEDGRSRRSSATTPTSSPSRPRSR